MVPARATPCLPTVPVIVQMIFVSGRGLVWGGQNSCAGSVVEGGKGYINWFDGAGAVGFSIQMGAACVARCSFLLGERLCSVRENSCRGHYANGFSGGSCDRFWG